MAVGSVRVVRCSTIENIRRRSKAHHMTTGRPNFLSTPLLPRSVRPFRQLPFAIIASLWHGDRSDEGCLLSLLLVKLKCLDSLAIHVDVSMSLPSPARRRRCHLGGFSSYHTVIRLPLLLSCLAPSFILSLFHISVFFSPHFWSGFS